LTTSQHSLLVEYYENTGAADLALFWDSASQTKDLIPTSQLYPATGYPSAPTITLTSPANNSPYVNPAVVSLAATVTANLNGIDTVQFYYGSTPTLIGQVVNPPYTLNWTNPAAGSYNVFARAQYDNSAEHVDSSGATIAVTTTPPEIANTSVSGGNLTISGTGVQGQTFVLLKATNLVSPITWTPVATNSTGNGSFSFLLPAASPTSFFKVQSR
jgi:hypothetical protein